MSNNTKGDENTRYRIKESKKHLAIGYSHVDQFYKNYDGVYFYFTAFSLDRFYCDLQDDVLEEVV